MICGGGRGFQLHLRFQTTTKEESGDRDERDGGEMKGDTVEIPGPGRAASGKVQQASLDFRAAVQ